jgi:cytochrome c553
MALGMMWKFQILLASIVATCAIMMAFKKRERKHPEMRSIAPALYEKEIDELVVYYSTLPAR